ncbi:hypothetical protein ACHAQJ_008034 [Trichoderma viride]
MKKPSGDQSSWQQEDDHLSMSSDDAVQDSDARNRRRSRRIFSQPPVTINVFGAGVISTGGSDTGPTVATTNSSTGISGSSDPVISRLESQIADLSCKVEQLASQINSVQRHPGLQVDSGLWRTKDITVHSYPKGRAQQRVTFSKRFQSAPKVIVSIQKADVDCGAHFRVNVYASDIDSEGFTVHIDTWEDTIVYECGVSWVAIGNEKK